MRWREMSLGWYGVWKNSRFSGDWDVLDVEGGQDRWRVNGLLILEVVCFAQSKMSLCICFGLWPLSINLWNNFLMFDKKSVWEVFCW